MLMHRHLLSRRVNLLGVQCDECGHVSLLASGLGWGRFCSRLCRGRALHRVRTTAISMDVSAQAKVRWAADHDGLCRGGVCDDSCAGPSDS